MSVANIIPSEDPTKLTPDNAAEPQHAANWLGVAYTNSLQSADPSTQTGAVLVCRRLDEEPIGANGWNHVPFEHTAEQLQDRDWKMANTLHAERAAIFLAVRLNFSVRNGILYAPWAACCGCAQAIAMCGVKTVVTHKAMMDKTPPRWRAEVDSGLNMLWRLGVTVLTYDGPVNLVFPRDVRFDGKYWNPNE